jgi:hypothetical protein
MYAIYLKDKTMMEFNSQPLHESEVVLEKDEMTDGVVAFKPLKGWKCDTIVGNSKDGLAYHFTTEDSSKVFVSSVLGECRSRTDYYGLLREFGFPDSLVLKEISFKDSMITGNRYYLNTYFFIDDEDTVYMTFSALKDISSYKMMTMSTFEVNRHGDTEKMSDSFMNNVRFKLEKR